MKKKILFVITKSNWGGAQRYVFDLAVSLPNDEFDPIVAFGTSGKQGAKPGELGTRLDAAEIRTVFLPALSRNVGIGDMQAVFQLRALFRSELPDIVHLNSSKAVTMGALAARLARVPVIVGTVHGWAFNEPRPWWQKIIIKFIHWFGGLMCTHNIVVSQCDAQQAAHWPFVSRKIVAIHNGIAPFELHEKTEARSSLAAAHTELMNKIDQVWIGTNSELNANKSIDVLLRACATIDDPNAVYVAMGSGEHRTKLESLAKELGIAHKVFILGFVEDSRQYLKAFDIFVLPSRKEGLPYGLLEAGLASLPVIASRVGGIPEIIEDGQTGFLSERGNVAELASKLRELLENPAERERLGAALREKVRNKFSLEQMVEQTLKIYGK